MVPQSSPFPGMNPFLEQHWSDVHTRLITYICDAIATDLPMDLLIRAEERVSIIGGGPARPERSTVVPLAEPEVVLVEPMTERWIEIREGARLVTVIEVLSPNNKRDEGRAAYRLKQRDYLTALVNLVEIDLLRGGLPTVAVDLSRLRPTSGTAYTVCVSRAAVAGQREVYRSPLQLRLPAIRVPLRATDPDAALDLQPLIDRCYSAGRYWLADRDALQPALPADEATWVAAQLRAAGFDAGRT